MLFEANKPIAPKNRGSNTQNLKPFICVMKLIEMFWIGLIKLPSLMVNT